MQIEVDPVHIRVETIQTIEGPLLLMLDMDDHMPVVEQHPGAGVPALPAQRGGGVLLLQLSLDLVHDRVDLTVRGSRAEEEASVMPIRSPTSSPTMSVASLSEAAAAAVRSSARTVCEIAMGDIQLRARNRG